MPWNMKIMQQQYMCRFDVDENEATLKEWIERSSRVYVYASKQYKCSEKGS